MQKTIAKGLFYGVATILLLWTGSLTYAFVAAALPQAHWLVPLFALVVFDVGMLAWLYVYLNYAEGSGQRAVALVMCIFDFLGVGLMVLAEILLGGQNLVSVPAYLGEYALWSIAMCPLVMGLKEEGKIPASPPGPSAASLDLEMGRIFG